MIFSQEKMFGDKVQITINNSGSEYSYHFPEIIDLGPSEKPYRVKKAFKRNVGGGDPIPIMASINAVDSSIGIDFSFFIDSSPDNATWTELFQSQKRALHSATFKKLHYKINVGVLPDNADRYLRMGIFIKSTATAANQKMRLSGAIGTYQPSNGLLGY